MSSRTVEQIIESSETTSSSCVRPDQATYFSHASPSPGENVSVAMYQGCIGCACSILYRRLGCADECTRCRSPRHRVLALGEVEQWRDIRKLEPRGPRHRVPLDFSLGALKR